MNPLIIPALITGGAALFGGERANKNSAREAARNRDFNAAEALKSREFNALEAQKARDFSAEQSATEVQRRVADLRAAGLNPALALGSTASSGGGVAASGGSASSGSMPNFQNNVATGVNSALGAVQVARAFQEMQIQQKLAQAQVEKMRAETGDIQATQAGRVASLFAGADLSVAGAGRSREETSQMKDLFGLKEQLLRMQVLQTRNSAAEAEGRMRELALRSARDESAFRTGFGRFAPFLNSADSVLRSIFGAEGFERMRRRSFNLGGN